jgi:hypothetical protein
VADSAVALAYASTWADADAAEQFAALYAAYVPKRYSGAKEIGAAPKPKVGTFEPGTKEVMIDIGQRMSGAHTWSTGQGTVLIEVRGNRVLVLEGFDDAASARLRAVVFGNRAD